MTRSNSATFSGLPSFILPTICDEYGITCDKSDEVNHYLCLSLEKEEMEPYLFKGGSAVLCEQKYRKVISVPHDTRALHNSRIRQTKLSSDPLKL